MTKPVELTDAELDHVAGGDPLRGGQAVAEVTHNSGPGGASGNENASGGVGQFAGPDSAEAIHKVQKRK